MSVIFKLFSSILILSQTLLASELEMLPQKAALKMPPVVLKTIPNPRANHIKNKMCFGEKPADTTEMLSDKNVLSKRPDDLKAIINSRFESVKKKTYSGEDKETYFIAGLNFERIIQNLIHLNPGREINILDIGAGNGAWGNHMADFIEEQYQKSKSKFHVNIYNISEHTPISWSDKLEREHSTVFSLFRYKIEDIQKLRQCLGLTEKVDLIVSSGCFEQLLDPLGTFIQAYAFLKPGSGIMAIDGFRIMIEGQYVEGLRDFSHLDQNTLSLFQYIENFMDAGIIRFHDSKTMLDNVVVHRFYNNIELRLPLKYGPIRKMDYFKCLTGCMPEFITTQSLPPFEPAALSNKWFADQTLFRRLERDGYFNVLFGETEECGKYIVTNDFSELYC